MCVCSPICMYVCEQPFFLSFFSRKGNSFYTIKLHVKRSLLAYLHCDGILLIQEHTSAGKKNNNKKLN